MANYQTITDAKNALANSGVYEWFDIKQLDDVIEYMYRNNTTPEEAAQHFGVC